MPLAYSYIRFSTPEQADGDSLRRQTALTAAWCERNKVQLDKSLSFVDPGRTGHKRTAKDFDAYALADFIRQVEGGRVQPGSFLIVENLDRLSRESEVVAVNRFTGILLAGVNIVQLFPREQVFTNRSGMGDLINAIVEFSRGHSESRTKVERGGSAWGEKRANAATAVMTRKVPGWFRRDAGDVALIVNGRPVVCPDRAATVRRIYAMAAGGHGVHSISVALNADSVPTFGYGKRAAAKWTESVVYHVLTSRAVIGEFQPHRGRGGDRQPAGPVIPDYFPAVIPADLFHAAAAALRSRTRTKDGKRLPAGASRSQHVNLFGGLIRDARDGGTFTYKHHGTRSPVLIPVGAKIGRGTKWTSFPARTFEAAILTCLAELKPSDVLPDQGGADQVAVLSARHQDAADQVAKLKAKINQRPELVDVLGDTLADWEAKRRGFAAAVADAQREAASPVSEAWGEFQSLAHLAADGTDDERTRLRAALRRIIDSVYVLFADRGADRLAAAEIHFRTGGQPRRYSIMHRGPRANHLMTRVPGHWWASSFRLPDGSDADVGLRDQPQHLTAYLAHLTAYDPAGESPGDWGDMTRDGEIP